jgi:hypothetical protein
MTLGGQHNAPAAFTPRKTHCALDGWDDAALCALYESSHDSSGRLACSLGTVLNSLITGSTRAVEALLGAAPRLC